MVGPETATKRRCQVDPGTGLAEELMSPAFYLPLSWDIQAEARSWEGTTRRLRKRSERRSGICRLSQRTGRLSVSQSTTRSDTLFSAGVGNIRRSSEACSAPCVAKAWATIPSAGEVVEFTITRESTGYAWISERVISVGGAPWDLEVASDNSRLVGTDLEGQRIFSINLSDESIQSLSIGTIAGPISLSTDNQVLLVTRPQLEDALLLDTVDLSGEAFANISGPALSCVASCRRIRSVWRTPPLQPAGVFNDAEMLERGPITMASSWTYMPKDSRPGHRRR